MAASIKEEEELWLKRKNFGHNQLLLVGGQNVLKVIKLGKLDTRLETQC